MFVAAAKDAVCGSFDSYPYVCIIMLSDTTSMAGGHTYLRTGDGSPHKVKETCKESCTNSLKQVMRRSKVPRWEPPSYCRAAKWSI